MITVIVTDKAGKQRSIASEKKELTLGSAEGSDVVLDDGSVSKYHARIVEKDDRLILVDLRSDAGVYVNRRRVRTPQVVSPRDQIRIGTFLLALKDGDRPAGPRPAESARVTCPHCGAMLRYKRLADYCPACDVIFD